MEKVYKKHRDKIIGLFQENDIDHILVYPLKSNFDRSAIERILNEKNEKVKIFFEEFEAIKTNVKFLNFLDVSSDVSEWIARFLISQDDGYDAIKRFDISINLINKNGEFFIENFVFNYATLSTILKDKLITKRTYATLCKTLDNDGELIAKYRLMPLIHVYSIDCYSKFLYLCSTNNRIYLDIFHNDLYNLIEESRDNEEIKALITAVSCSEIDNFDYDDSKNQVASSNLDDLSMDSYIIEVMSSTQIESSQESSNTDTPQSSFNRPDDESINTDTISSNVPRKSDLRVEDSDSSDDDSKPTDDYDKWFGVCENKKMSEILIYRSTLSTSSDVTLEVRNYQSELALKAAEGQNVLICAPTSSGKTVVAIKIAEEHMQKNPTGKIALVVPTTVLVEQQFNLFWKYLRKKFRINKLSGGTKTNNVALSKQIDDFDIFVFTSDILRNSLEDQEEPLKSISQFSLIIFDECHHCDKDHSYNKVMDHYFKDQQADKKVPQIIGMTASTGTDKAKSVDAALKSLVSLCANLDSKIISTVSINIDELNMNVATPSNEIKSPGSRVTDLFESGLLSLIESIEHIVHGIFRSKNKPIGIPTDRYHDKYLSFVKGITNHHPDLLSDEERKGVKIIETYLENLYRALIVNHLFHSTHAIEMLKEKIDAKGPITSDIEVTLRQLFIEFLLSTSLEQDKNPSLECLKDEIVRQIKEDKKSKIIVFVKEVNYTRILESEIQSARLGFIECKALVGTNKAAEQGGLSKSETEDIVAKFRKGIINLLFTTSVAEEGLDVEKCNLVLRYGYVTNEISMVQTRGRARASNSKYIVIVPDKLKWQINKENINKVRESMMYKAIDKFQTMDLSELRRQIFECQEKRHALRTVPYASAILEPAPPRVSTDYWDLHCNKCERYICSSDDLRLANGTTYIVVNGLTYENMKMTTNQQNNYPLLCVACGLLLGYVIKVENINMPSLKITQCIIKRDKESMRKKKWKDVPFKVVVVERSDLIQCQTSVFND